MIKVPTYPAISMHIPPNYSTWQTIELSYQCAKYAIDNNIPGDFVECGVAAGNNLAAMCLAGRKGYGYDSFIGIPWAGMEDEYQPGFGKVDPDKIGLLETSGGTVHSENDVHTNFKKWKVDNYELIKGWFQNTTCKHEGKISVLRLDGDLYDSTIVCLIDLYPFLSKGGILIMDDWELLGCQKAFNDYFQGIEKPEMILDNTVTYWKK